ncbi:bacteriohemerythrin [Thauera humireducens]|uniref:bacteriohemerythrin n=1 Tax=Thauera humireducens TaxID=1134435 RepID=UPI00311FB822
MIVWSPAIEVGVPEMDADHRILVELLNRAAEAVDCDEALSILGELECYADHHFAREEQLMEAHSYEFIDEHRREHQTLFFDVRNHIEDLMAGKGQIENVTEFLRKWLLNHIAGEDRLLGTAIRRQWLDDAARGTRVRITEQ